MFGNREIILLRCLWGMNLLEHKCMLNTRKKMTHDYLRGYGFLHEFIRLGTRILFVLL